jgi:hypothetical protein
MQTPLAARRKQPVKREQAQDFLPVRAFAAATQTRGEERIKLEVVPELIGQPPRALGTGTGEFKLAGLDLHGGRGAIGGRDRAAAGLPVVFVKDVDGLLPRGALGIVDLAQAGDMPLPHAGPDAAAFDDLPGARLLAVLFARAGLERHVARVTAARRMRRGWVATTRRLTAESGGILRESAGRYREKTRSLSRNRNSG